MPEFPEYKITLLDGVCTEETLCETPEGIRYGSLKAAMAGMGSDIRSLLPEVSDGHDGAFIYIPEGVKAGGVVVVENRVTGRANNETTTESAVLLMDSASATVRYEVRCDTAGVLSDSRSVRLGDRASLRFEEIVFGGGDREKGEDGESSGGRISVESRSQLGEGAVMDAVTVETGGADTSLKYRTDLAGRNASAGQAGLFVIGGEEKADFDVVVNHLVPDCRSDVVVKGVAGGNARGSFSGLVYVAQDAQHTEAYQQSRNLLLTDTAQIITAPQLEIYADDVKCSHGATVGQMNDDAIYYMRQRGLSEEQARGLQMTGFVNDIVSRIGNEDTRKEIFANLKI